MIAGTAGSGIYVILMSGLILGVMKDKDVITSLSKTNVKCQMSNKAKEQCSQDYVCSQFALLRAK